MFIFFVSLLLALAKSALMQQNWMSYYFSPQGHAQHMDMTQEAYNLFLLDGECGNDPQVYKWKELFP